MDKRIKYSFNQKLSIVQAIKAGKISANAAANKIGAHHKTVQCWLGIYIHHGAAGLKFRHGSYTGKFKLQVINHMLKKNLSLIETAAFFGIPNGQAVGRWVNKYEQEGKAGLLQEPRGRKKTMMVKKPKKHTNVSSDSVDAKLAALQSEVEYLRAENAFLKKLDALIQEEKAAKKPNKRQ